MRVETALPREPALLREWSDSSIIVKPPRHDAIETGPPRSAAFQLETLTDASGRTVFSFNHMALSDIHLYTKQCRAKRTAHMLENTRTNHLYLGGDIIDGEYMGEKSTFHSGPYHRQIVAHFIRKVADGTEVVYTPGNHDTLLRKIIRKPC